MGGEVQTSDQIAEMLIPYGVSHFFFVPVILPETVKRMGERGILPVMTHGEKAAAYMADGYARISRKVGLCGAQAIGSTNLAAGLRDAYMARAPIVNWTFHDTDLVGIARGFGCHGVRVDDPGDFPRPWIRPGLPGCQR